MGPAVDGMVPGSLDVSDHQVFFRLEAVIRSSQIEESDVDGEEVIERLRTLQSQSLEDAAHSKVWIFRIASRIVEDKTEEVELKKVAIRRIVKIEKPIQECVTISVSSGGDFV